jgi:hypothetical protein
LTVELRVLLAVCTPGRNCTNSSVLRLETGRLVIDFVLTVVDTAADWVWITSVAACTSTVSERPPTSSRGRTVAGVPALTCTPFSTAVLKPVSVTVTV